MWGSPSFPWPRVGSGHAPMLRTAEHTISTTCHYLPGIYTGRKLYCLMTEAHRCEKLAHGCYSTEQRLGFELATTESQVQCPTARLLHTHTHTTILRPSWILSGTTRVSQQQKGKTREVKPIWIYWSKRQ